MFEKLCWWLKIGWECRCRVFGNMPINYCNGKWYRNCDTYHNIKTGEIRSVYY